MTSGIGWFGDLASAIGEAVESGDPMAGLKKLAELGAEAEPKDVECESREVKDTAPAEAPTVVDVKPEDFEAEGCLKEKTVQGVKFACMAHDGAGRHVWERVR